MQATTLLRAYDTPRAEKILVALSGGADSVALLLSLREIGAEVCAAHINHMLRGDESDRDEAFCRSLCERLGVPLAVARRDVNAERGRGESLEDAARRIRYEELLAAAKRFGAPLVATAHTANDNAETVLLNLARGSGGAGVAGIPPTRPLGDGVAVVRPLLGATRDEVEAFLAERGQPFVTDSTNLTSDYTRNLIRREVLPPLLKANVRAIEHLCAAAEQARQDEEYLAGEAQRLFDIASDVDDTPDALRGSTSAASAAGASLMRAQTPCSPQHPTARISNICSANIAHHSTPPIQLDIKVILAAPPALATRALRLAYTRAGGAALSRTHTNALLALSRTPDPSASLNLPNGITARRVYDTLVLEKSASPEAYTVTFTPAPARKTPGGFSLEKPVYLDPTREYFTRTRRTGDTFSTENWTKSLKKLMIDLKIPAHLRDSLPVIVADPDSSEVAALPGFAAAKGFAAPPGADALEVTLN